MSCKHQNLKLRPIFNVKNRQNTRRDAAYTCGSSVGLQKQLDSCTPLSAILVYLAGSRSVREPISKGTGGVCQRNNSQGCPLASTQIHDPHTTHVCSHVHRRIHTRTRTHTLLSLLGCWVLPIQTDFLRRLNSGDTHL